MEKVINIKVEKEKWQDALDKAFKKVSKDAKLDGFRKGKVPKDVFLKQKGIEVLYPEAADYALQDAYSDMLKELKGEQIVAEPAIELNEINEDHIDFKFTVTLRPTVKLGKYKGLKTKKEKVEVTDKEIKDAIEHMRSHYAENVLKEGKIADGDIAIIDYEGFKDGVAFEGGKAENYSLKIGSGTFIPGFEEQLIGLKAGDEKEINVTFPEEYHSEELKGQPVVFKIKVHEVKEVKIPEINDDFFTDLGLEGIDTIEALEKQVRENIEVQKETTAENNYIDGLLEEAASHIEVEIPDVMIEDELKRMLGQYEENLKMQGLTLEQFYQFTNSDEFALKDQMKPEAENRIKFRLMLEEIAKVEGIEIDEKRALEEASRLAEKYQMEKDAFLDNFGGLEMVKYDLQMRQAIEVLKQDK